MARITVEDCLEVIPNRFDLTLAAAKRARDLATGKEALVDREDDKVAVVALREIAAGHTDFSEPEPHEIAFDAFKAPEEIAAQADDEEFDDEEDGMEAQDEQLEVEAGDFVDDAEAEVDEADDSEEPKQAE